MVAQLALSLNRLDDFKRAAASLDATYPNEMATHYFAAFRAALESDWMRAEREIKTAERLGLPASGSRVVLDLGVRRPVRAWRCWLGRHCGALGLRRRQRVEAGVYVAVPSCSMAAIEAVARNRGRESRRQAHSELSRRRLYRTAYATVGICYGISLALAPILALGGTANGATAQMPRRRPGQVGSYR